MGDKVGNGVGELDGAKELVGAAEIVGTNVGAEEGLVVGASVGRMQFLHVKRQYKSPCSPDAQRRLQSSTFSDRPRYAHDRKPTCALIKIKTDASTPQGTYVGAGVLLFVGTSVGLGVGLSEGSTVGLLLG